MVSIEHVQRFLLYIANPLLIIFFMFLGSKILLSLVKTFLSRSSLDEALHKFIINIVKYVIYVVIALIALDSMGLDTKSLITVMGVAGGAVALSLKDSLSNVAGGFIILVTKPFSKGDFVDINGTQGEVEQIDVLLTTLKTADNKTITIPNGLVSTAVIMNFTKAERRRVDCLFALDHGADVKKAKELMKQVAMECELILHDEPIVAGVAKSTPAATELEFKVWAKTEAYWDVKYYLEEKIKESFEAENINMAKNVVVSN